MKKNLMWFRNDLRTYDNTALHYACKLPQDDVIALFINTPDQWKKHNLSKKKISFMHQNILSLKQSLYDLNIILYYYQSTDFLNAIKYLIYFCKKNKIDNVFYNYQYEYNEFQRDSLVNKLLAQNNILVKGFHDTCLVNVNEIKSQKDNAYQIFSFFKKKIIDKFHYYIPLCLPIPSKRKIKKKNIMCKYLIKNLNVCFDNNLFPAGEKSALNKLNNFLKYKVKHYSMNRNFPFMQGTSLLSPYLSLGVISSRNCLQKLLQNININSQNINASSWMNEILWREFYYHLLIGFPEISQYKSLKKWEKYIVWEDNSDYFSAWKKGNTGFPIVDAGMRQLNKLGWMHNRLRMITSSFLVKNLLINWRKGEKYFMSRLIDGDLALNNGGWQWAASIGSDSVPYVRIFNPWNQSKSFDKSGIFIKEFIPELKIVPHSEIHEPHKWANKTKLKLNYPKPIIDYQKTRKKFLLIFNTARFK